MNSFFFLPFPTKLLIHIKTGCLLFHDELILFRKLEHVLSGKLFHIIEKVRVVVDSFLVVLDK